MTGDRGQHPLDERYIEVYGFHGEAAPVDADGVQRLLCPLCRGMLVLSHRVRGGHRYFTHKESADGDRCPLTTLNYQPDGMSIRCERNPIVELEHRPRFLRHWQRHYRLAKSAAPMLTLEQFAGLIAHADVLNLWSYPMLDERDIPYVLLVLAGFLTERSASGEVRRVRFWYDGSVRDVGDLWHEERRTPATLFRIVYRNPLQTPFPTSTSILYWESVRQLERLVDGAVPRLPRAQVQAFARFLERHEADRRESGVAGTFGTGRAE